MSRVAKACDNTMNGLRIFHGLLCGAALAVAAEARQPVRSLDDVRRLEAKVSGLTRKALPATVALISDQTGASGSGVIVSANGLIYTAAHVVEGNDEMTVQFADGREGKAKVLGANLSKDIAMARMEGDGPWPFVEIGESKPLEAGDWVAAMGNSKGFDLERPAPLRFGRVVSDGPGNFLTTDCTLIGGDSGGPLFDLEGRLVGINSSIGRAWINNNHSGVDGFAEDRERLQAGEVWGELQMNPLLNPEKAAMGVILGDQTRDGGVVVVGVNPGGPAAQAGIRAGDVLRTINGARLRGGGNLTRLLAKQAPGDVVRVGFLRNGAMSEVEVTLVQMDQIPQFGR